MMNSRLKTLCTKTSRAEREKRQHHGLLRFALRAHEHDPVRAGYDDVVVAQVVRLVRVSQHLPDLVLERVLVQVALGALLGHDAVGDDHVHLVSVQGVPEEDHVQQISLMVRQQRLP